MQGSGERLPWLNDEPASARATRTPVSSRRQRAMWPFYAALVALIMLVGGGGWWLGTRQRSSPPPQLPTESVSAAPIIREQLPAAEQAPEAVNAVAPPSAASSPRARPMARSQAPEQRGSEQAQEPTSEPNPDSGETLATRAVFPSDESFVGPPPPTTPRPVVVYHPQLDRGRVVQLGAFATRAQAEGTWRKVTRRYPYLTSKPKMVNTVDVRALGGGRRTRMYRLQLGTSSQAQSVVICQQLEKAGHSCVVVY